VHAAIPDSRACARILDPLLLLMISATSKGLEAFRAATIRARRLLLACEARAATLSAMH
jgi:hypothetical protein